MNLIRREAKMVKIFIDTETTGLDKENDSIVQISGIIQTDTIEEPFDFYMRPYKPNKMSRGAYMATGYDDEMVSSWPDQKGVFEKFISLLDKYMDTETFNDRAFVVGYNVGFDTDFIREWFKYNNKAKMYARYFISPNLDVMTLAGFALAEERRKMENFKLTTVYEHIFGRKFDDAHNSFADIKATKELFEHIGKILTPNLVSENTKKVIPVRQKRS